MPHWEKMGNASSPISQRNKADASDLSTGSVQLLDASLLRVYGPFVSEFRRTDDGWSAFALASIHNGVDLEFSTSVREDSCATRQAEKCQSPSCGKELGRCREHIKPSRPMPVRCRLRPSRLLRWELSGTIRKQGRIGRVAVGQHFAGLKREAGLQPGPDGRHASRSLGEHFEQMEANWDDARRTTTPRRA